jgi:hypothetical protein
MHAPREYLTSRPMRCSTDTQVMMREPPSFDIGSCAGKTGHDAIQWLA